MPLLLAASLTAGLKGCGAPAEGYADDEQELAAASAAPKISLSWSNPPSAPVSDKVALTLRGEGLVNVEVFRDGKMVVRATVASDGKSARAEVDTRSWSNGPVELSAHAWDSAPGTEFKGEADAGVLKLTVDNKKSESTPRAEIPAAGSAAGDHHPDGYTLLFSDEFEASELDRGKWCTRYVYGGGPALQVPDAECQRGGDGTLDFLNDEQQRYVDTNRDKKKMHELHDGVLTLWATKTRDDDYAKYESAMLRSKKVFRPDASTSYYITARLKLPSVKGSWPAFWLNSDRKSDGSTTWPPEIDIIDAALNDKDDRAEMLHQAAIVKGKQTKSGESEYTFVSPEYDSRWSNYTATSSQRDKWIEVAVKWSADSICYFVDGYKTVCENYHWVDDDGHDAPPAHVLLNLAIGGGWAGRYGVDDAKFPIRLQADYVRVYKGSK
ncbi:MAG: hypothetical protein RLZZ450_6861 [Pseudomonadota bacterium]